MRVIRGFQRMLGAKTGKKRGFPEKSLEKPEKTCGNAGFSIDKRF
jgi:hypothetical protein